MDHWEVVGVGMFIGIFIGIWIARLLSIWGKRRVNKKGEGV